ncbi:MAG: glycosyltransferase [Flavobacteriaceae bacterium]
MPNDFIKKSYKTAYLAKIYIIFKFLRKKNSKLISEDLAKGAKGLPSITLVAPAYNEGLTIITNVYSLLSIQYPNYSLIIVNDGGQDNSLSQLIEEFNLIDSLNFTTNKYILCAPIKRIFKSTNSKYANLTIVDKENGGRADALNAGISQATKFYSMYRSRLYYRTKGLTQNGQTLS